MIRKCSTFFGKRMLIIYCIIFTSLLFFLFIHKTNDEMPRNNNKIPRNIDKIARHKDEIHRNSDEIKCYSVSRKPFIPKSIEELPQDKNNDEIKCYSGSRKPFIPNSIEELPADTAPDVPIYFPVDEPNFCSDNPELDVIAYVASTLSATDRRNITRRTWGSAYKYGIRLRVVFMVGRPKNASEEKILHTESDLYHDMIQGNYTDEYHLVTYKILSAMYWVSTRCPSVPWVIRADDDILIDPFLLYELLPMVTVEGFNCWLWPLPKVKRDGKWAMTKQQWKYNYYPPFCAGAFIFHHHQILHRLLNASCRTPLKVWMEDVYVFGLLAEQAGGIKQILKVMKHCHKNCKIKENDLGKITSWIEVKNRTTWWEKIKKFHNICEIDLHDH